MDRGGPEGTGGNGSARENDPAAFQFPGTLLDLDDSFLGYTAGVDDLVCFQLIAEQPQYLTVFGHLVTSFHNDLHGIVHEIIIKVWFPSDRNNGFL